MHHFVHRSEIFLTICFLYILLKFNKLFYWNIFNNGTVVKRHFNQYGCHFCQTKRNRKQAWESECILVSINFKVAFYQFIKCFTLFSQGGGPNSPKVKKTSLAGEILEGNLQSSCLYVAVTITS